MQRGLGRTLPHAARSPGPDTRIRSYARPMLPRLPTDRVHHKQEDSSRKAQAIFLAMDERLKGGRIWTFATLSDGKMIAAPKIRS